MTRAALVTALFFAVFVSGAASRGASSGSWLSPTVLDPQGGSSATVAVTPGGVAVAAWSSGLYTRVSTRGRNHHWGPISTPVKDDLFFYPELAVDMTGDALLTGVDPGRDVGGSVVAYERSADSATWSGPITVGGKVWSVGPPDLAGNDDGQAIVAWREADYQGDLEVIRAALRRGDGSWEAPQSLGYGGFTPSSAIDAHGDAVVVWQGGGRFPDSRVYAEFHPAGGTWESAVVLSQRTASDAAVRMNRRGDALAVWAEWDSTGRPTLVSSLRRAGVSQWTTPSPISISDPGTTLLSYYGTSFDLDEAGSATLVARRRNGEVEAATSRDGVDWTGPVVLGDAGSDNAVLTDHWCLHPEVAQDGVGDTLVLWGGADLHAVRRRAGSSTWGKPVIVAHGPSCFEQAVAADPNGNAVTVWNASSQAVTQLDAAVLDATPPVLTKIIIPRAAKVGRGARFSVTATDLWSKLASAPLWRFGDGTNRRGRALEHVFRQPGRYRVSVTVADQAGNAATSAATVRVTAQR